ncbi:hypothetical protein [Leucobacter sp. G161]|uniref:hypothetical protein n=1 Tax=Leucobacter sp. G161 TaxID=663704 RepID=UPI000B2665B3|nr:hypothetical protein [Leucobacter sp. G161]
MKDNKHVGITYGIPLGVGAAFAIGLSTDDLGFWLSICIPAGIVIGTLYDSTKNRDKH